MTTPGLAPAPSAPAPKPLTHACVRCGAQIPLEMGLCERCNPLGLRDSSASQAHGTVVIAVLVGVIGLALLGRLTLAGLGPFTAQVADVASTDAGLAVTLTVRNDGTATGQTTCRLTDPKDRNGGRAAFVLSPRIEGGATMTFTQTITELGSAVRELTVQCSAP